LRLRSLRAKIEASRIRSSIIADRFQAAVTGAEKDRLARRYDDALQRAHQIQHRLEALERREREAS